MSYGQDQAPGLAGLRRLLAGRYARPVDDIQLKTGLMRGGLTAKLLHVSVARPGAAPERFVVKRTAGNGAREAAAYDALAACGIAHAAPRLLGAAADDGGCYLFLEYVSRRKAWPWRNEEHAGMVLDLLAAVHGAPVRQDDALRAAYEEHLQRAAAYTLELSAAALREIADVRLARGAAVVRALLSRLPQMRGELLASPVFLHGDVHPGNVRVRADGGRHRAVLLDWGLARMGSRFEDVACWLQCLRYFEPAAVGAHDRLLLRYMRAAGLGARITAAHRREYWMAAGCNALAGALGVHLASALTAASSDARERSVAAAADWLRIARRALAYLDSRAERRH